MTIDTVDILPRASSDRHARSHAFVRDVVLGMADGLTVPFALAAGVTAAHGTSNLVITAGAAEIAAGAIAMGLGGYLAAQAELDQYRGAYRREMRETETVPDEERTEVREILSEIGLYGPHLHEVVDAIASDPHRWVNFMMRYELGLAEPNARHAPVSAATIGASYVVGGIIPLLPYFFASDAMHALTISAIVTLLALFVFGLGKARITSTPILKSGLQTMLIGALASGVAFILARLIHV
jgi:VIT1/CCC1 family predicted Fe2+/Mn2+ transporter